MPCDGALIGVQGLLLVLSLHVCASTRVQPAVATNLQRILEAKALEFNTSFSVGIWSETGAWTAVAGLNDRRKRTPMTSDLQFPLGSVTKTYTAASVMQAYEKGLIDIDKPIAPYVDPILQRQNGTTLLELWNGDRNISNVTARQLMQMRRFDRLQAHNEVS